MMPTIEEICRFLNELAPLDLAEDWDNVGLLVGDPAGSGQRIMTCLTITPASAAEAVAAGANLIVTHHPLPFQSLKRITTQTPTGQLLWQLTGAGISVYSAHTAYDSARQGINTSLAQRLGLVDLEPLQPCEQHPEWGAGRVGQMPQSTTLAALVATAKSEFGLGAIPVVGDLDRKVSQVAVACGSGGSFLEAAHQAGCDALVTGEARFHTALEAEARGIALLLLGHYTSERFALESLAEQLQARFVDAEIWASREESDPLQWC